MRKICINQVRCDRCGEVIVSRHRHDLRWCKCRGVAVDGGTDYLRRITGDASASFTELSEYEDELVCNSSAQTGLIDKYLAHQHKEKKRKEDVRYGPTGYGGAARTGYRNSDR